MVIDFNQSGFLSYIEQFHGWYQLHPSYREYSDEDKFSLFFQEYNAEKTPFEVKCDMAFQIYQYTPVIDKFEKPYRI